MRRRPVGPAGRRRRGWWRVGASADRRSAPRAGRGGGREGVPVRYSEVSARYREFALVPVREATTVAALRGWAPASTSARRASRAAGSGARASDEAGGGGGGPPPTTPPPGR